LIEKFLFCKLVLFCHSSDVQTAVWSLRVSGVFISCPTLTPRNC